MLLGRDQNFFSFNTFHRLGNRNFKSFLDFRGGAGGGNPFTQGELGEGDFKGEGWVLSSSLSGDSSCHSCCRLTSVSSGIMLYNSFSSVSYLTQQICSQVFIKISQEFPQIQYHSNSHRTQLLRLASFGSLEPQSRTCKEMGSIQRGGLKYMNRIQLILIFI